VGGLNTTEVREWAKAQGIEVKDRGRIPADWSSSSDRQPASEERGTPARRRNDIYSSAEMSISPCAYLYTGWHTHSRPADLACDYHAAFSIVSVGNQIADQERL